MILKKHLSTVVIAAALAFFLWQEYAGQIAPQPESHSALYQAITNRASDVQVAGSGTVIKVLPDDNYGSRHQRFLVKLENGHVILVAHNIDLAPRIQTLQAGEEIAF